MDCAMFYATQSFFSECITFNVLQQYWRHGHTRPALATVDVHSSNVRRDGYNFGQRNGFGAV